MIRTLLRHFLVLEVLVVVSLVPTSVAGSTLEDDLAHIFVGRSFTIRNFYRGSHLEYQSDGKLAGKAESGYWSRDGMVEFSSVRISPDNKLTMQGKRTCILLDTHQGEFSNVTTGDNVVIEVQLSPDQLKFQSIISVLQKILLNDHDRLSDLVPSYWANCVSKKVDRRDKNSPWECLGSRNQGAPDFAGKKLNWDTPLPDNSLHNGMQMYTLVHNIAYLEEDGVTTPRLQVGKDPIFQWEQRRKTLDSITLVLSFDVDGDGKPTNIMIVSPVGMGLDDEAAEALAAWKFAPGKRLSRPCVVHARAIFNINRPNTQLYRR